MFGFVPRSLAVVGIAGVLVFAVPVTAQALVLPSPKIAGEMVIGAVKAAAPKIATAATFAGRASPVGTLLTVGQLLYMTRDSWMPWVQNEFGVGGTTSAQVGTRPFTAALVVNASLAGVSTFSITHSATGNGLAVAGYTYSCKDAASGTISYSGHLNMTTPYYTSFAVGQTTSVSVQCVAGQALNGFQSEKDPNYPTANTVNYGAPFDAQTGATYRVDVDCQLADGTIATVSSTTAAPQGGGLAVPSCAAAFPGSHGVSLYVNGAPTGSPLVKQYQADWQRTSTLYPNCVGAGVACSYVLRYNNVPCVAGQTECIGWALKQDLETEAGKYECWYGPYLLTLADCGLLERVYEKTGTTLTNKNTDGDPRTYDVTDPNGNPVPEPGASPVPVPIPPGAPGGAPVPIDPTTPLPSPPSTPTTAGNCWSALGASWNPLDWVLRPVQCALSWAFVPSQAAVSGPIADFKTTWNSKPPGSLIVGATSVFSSIGSGWNGGCSGSASASFSQPELGSPLQLPCTPSGGGSGTVPYTAMQIALIVATLIYLWHMVAAGISAQATGAGD